MKKYIALILSILMLVPALFSCGTDKPDEPQTSDTITETEAETVSDAIYNTMDISKFSISYPDIASSGLANAVKKAIKDKTGVELTMFRDKREVEYEIIVGAMDNELCNKFFADSVKNSDKYGILVDGKKIYLAGLDETTVSASVKYFVDTYLTNGTTFEIEDKLEALMQIDLAALNIPAKEGENTLRFLTNNILLQSLRNNPSRAYGILQAYALVKPDVVALQECDDLWYNKTKFLDYMKLLGYELVISDDRVNTPLLYNTHTVKLIESGFNDYDATNKVNAFRSYQWALLEQISTGKRFIAASTHLIARTPEGYSADAGSLRTQSASQAAKELEQLSKQHNAPVIFGGDFNSNATTSAYSQLCAKFSSARIACKSKKNMEYYTHLGEKDAILIGTATSAIDHVFYSKNGVTPKHYETLIAPITYAYTDHLSVSFDFELN